MDRLYNGADSVRIRQRHGVGMSESVKPFLWEVRVYYEDTDAGGVVYYANYLRFMERARTEWLRQLGFEQDELIEKTAVLFAVRSARLEFLRPAHFNQLLQVSVEPVRVGRASMTFRQQVRVAGTDTVCCEGEVRVASLDARTLRPRPIPRSVHARLPAVNEETKEKR